MTEQSLGRRIAHAMLAILVFQVFLKFGGMIVYLLAFNYFGKHNLQILDAFTIAEKMIIWPLVLVFEKLINPTLIPLFSEERELRGEESGWKLVNSYGTALAIILAVSVAALMLNADGIIAFLAGNGRNPTTVLMAAEFTRWMAPALFFLGMGSFTYAVLNANKRFSYAAAGAAMHRLAQAVIFFIAFWVLGANPVWAALAFVIASPMKLITHFIGLRDKLGQMKAALHHWEPAARPAIRWGAECCGVCGIVFFIDSQKVLLALVLFLVARGLYSWLGLRKLEQKTLMQKFYLLGYPVLLGVAIAWLRDIVQDSYATRLDTGIFSAIKFAKNFIDVPTAFIPLALSFAMFPFLCDMFTKQDLPALSGVVSKSIKMVALFFLPLTAVTVVLSGPIIDVMTSEKVARPVVTAASFALAIYALGFVFYTIEMVLMQTFFSLQNTWTPTIVGAAASFAQIGFLYVAFAVMEKNPQNWFASAGLTPFIVVVMAFPISRALKNIVLAAILHRRLGLFSGRDAYRFIPQVILLTAASGAVAWFSLKGLAGMSEIIRAAVPALAAALTFGALLVVFKKISWQVYEFELIADWLRETGLQKICSKMRGKNER